MNTHCGLCRQPFKTGESTVMVGTKIRGAVHTACKARVDSGSNFVRDYTPVPSAEAVERVSEALRASAHQPIIAYERKPDLNKTEAAYYEHLLALVRIGEIRRVDVQPEKLRLADMTYYIPDFRLIFPSGIITFDEVKGFMRDDAAVKLKVAAELHPYRFRLVRLRKGSSTKAPQWDISEVGSRS